MAIPRYEDRPLRVQALELQYELVQQLHQGRLVDEVDDPLGITPAARGVLRRLLYDHGGGPVPMKKLLAPPTTATSYLARVVDDLEEAGYVERDRSARWSSGARGAHRRGLAGGRRDVPEGQGVE